MNDLDVFDEFCKSKKELGPRLDLTGAAPELSELFFGRYLRRARAALNSASRSIARLPEVYADFVTNPEFNACAFKHRERYFIALNSGMPTIILMVINRMLADRDIFPTIGRSEMEARDLPRFVLAHPNLDTLSDSNQLPIVPKDSKRQIYAFHLTNLVFDFLTAHEIAHIAHGHVDYRGSLGMSYVNELEGLPRSNNGNLELQAMELDADSTAARALVNTVKSLVAGRSQLVPEIAAYYDQPTDAMFDVGVAVSITFRLFQDSTFAGIDLSDRSHPPTRWRQWQMLQMMGNFVGQFWDSNLVVPISESFSRALADVERAFELITRTEQKVQGLWDASQSADYTAKITDCWNHSLRNNLAKFAYIEPNYYEFERPSATQSDPSPSVSAFVETVDGRRKTTNGQLIQNSGQGPEIVGTRLTVYNLLPAFLDTSVTEEEICRIYSLTPQQVAAARAYILKNPESVLAEHLKIEERLATKNPPEVAQRAKQAQATFESYKQFLAARQVSSHTQANPIHERFPTFREWLADRDKQ